MSITTDPAWVPFWHLFWKLFFTDALVVFMAAMAVGLMYASQRDRDEAGEKTPRWKRVLFKALIKVFFVSASLALVSVFAIVVVAIWF